MASAFNGRATAETVPSGRPIAYPPTVAWVAGAVGAAATSPMARKRIVAGATNIVVAGEREWVSRNFRPSGERGVGGGGSGHVLGSLVWLDKVRYGAKVKLDGERGFNDGREGAICRFLVRRFGAARWAGWLRSGGVPDRGASRTACRTPAQRLI